MKYFTGLEIKWGIIFTIAGLLWMYFERAMGWHGENISQHAVMTNLFAIPAIAIIVFAQLEKRKRHYNGRMTWLQGFICGVMVSLVVAILAPLSQYIAHNYISPDYFDNLISYASSQGKGSPEELAKHFNMKTYMMLAAVGALVMGLITSALTALFTKRTRVA